VTNEYEYTRDLDLLGDWLDAKGYGEEAGLITRSMDYMHKQAARIAELEAVIDEAIEYVAGHDDEWPKALAVRLRASCLGEKK